MLHKREPKLVDVAVGKPASQSSISVWSLENDACGVLRGNTASDFGFHTDLDDKPWWKVDLGWLYPIYEIKVFNRVLVNQVYASNIVVEVSPDEKRWDLIHMGTAHFTADIPLTLPLAGKVNARYVRLSLPSRAYFHLSQVVVNVERFLAITSEVRFQNHTEEAVKRSVAIVGTSNSILRDGYVLGMRGQDNLLVDNKSATLGSSHGCMAIYRMQNIDWERTDFVLLDFCANEQMAVDAGRFDLGISRHVFVSTLNEACQRGKQPIALILPALDHIVRMVSEDNYSPAIRDHYIDMCQENNVPYFDGYEFILRLAEGLGWPLSYLFRDPMHLTSTASLALGQALALKLSHIELTSPNFDIVDYRPTRFINTLRSATSGSAAHRSTSLLSADVITLQEGETVEFDVGIDELIVGIGLNLAKTNAAISYNSSSKPQRLDSTQFGAGTWLAIWSLSRPIPAATGRAILTCLASSLEMEPNDHHRAGTPDYSKSPPTVEILGLVTMNTLTSKGLRPSRRAESLCISQGTNLEVLTAGGSFNL